MPCAVCNFADESNEPDYTGLLETWETLAENAEHSMDRRYEAWELELIKSNQANITVYEDFLLSIDDGERIVIPDVGDVTEQERKKAEWFLAYHKANLLKLREGAANDNEPPMDKELADLIACATAPMPGVRQQKREWMDPRPASALTKGKRPRARAWAKFLNDSSIRGEEIAAMITLAIHS